MCWPPAVSPPGLPTHPEPPVYKEHMLGNCPIKSRKLVGHWPGSSFEGHAFAQSEANISNDRRFAQRNATTGIVLHVFQCSVSFRGQVSLQLFGVVFGTVLLAFCLEAPMMNTFRSVLSLFCDVPVPTENDCKETWRGKKGGTQLLLLT